MKTKSPDDDFDLEAGHVFAEQGFRFDFDFELLVKLFRKGYRPAELPVNYRSRSFKERKKMRMLCDPLIWLQAVARLGFSKIDPLKAVGKDQTSATPKAAHHELPG